MATKSKGIGRGKGGGGKQPGAGRPRKAGSVVVEAVKKAPAKPKPKAKQTPSSLPKALDNAIKDALANGGLDDAPEPTLEDLEVLAKKAVAQVLRSGPQDGPRVSAAKLVREWADAERERKAEASGMTGKKAQAQAAAEAHIASGGRFAAPPPARSRFQ